VLFTSSNSRKVVPIFPTFCEWEGFKGTYSRYQFFIVLVFALTIYKSQGLTLNQVVLNISRKECTVGLTYIGISWVKKLLGLIFKQGFNKELFSPTAGTNKQA
jgi:ATP-dependent exoDNAse (exonuclease V) alpha subunit